MCFPNKLHSNYAELRQFPQRSIVNNLGNYLYVEISFVIKCESQEWLRWGVQQAKKFPVMWDRGMGHVRETLFSKI